MNPDSSVIPADMFVLWDIRNLSTIVIQINLTGIMNLDSSRKHLIPPI